MMAHEMAHECGRMDMAHGQWMEQDAHTDVWARCRRAGTVGRASTHPLEDHRYCFHMEMGP